MNTDAKCKVAVLFSIQENLIGPFEGFGVAACRRVVDHQPFASFERHVIERDVLHGDPTYRNGRVKAK